MSDNLGLLKEYISEVDGCSSIFTKGNNISGPHPRHTRVAMWQSA